MATSRVDAGLVARAAKALFAHDQRNQQKNQQLMPRSVAHLVFVACNAQLHRFGGCGVNIRMGKDEVLMMVNG